LYGGFFVSITSVHSRIVLETFQLERFAKHEQDCRLPFHSYQTGTACGLPSGAVTAMIATFGCLRSASISRLVIGIGPLFSLRACAHPWPQFTGLIVQTDSLSQPAGHLPEKRH
jgi:hypothetical protein